MERIGEAIGGGEGGGGVSVIINIENAFTDVDFPLDLAKKIDSALYELREKRESRLF